jgi:hypothetical protein
MWKFLIFLGWMIWGYILIFSMLIWLSFDSKNEYGITINFVKDFWILISNIYYSLYSVLIGIFILYWIIYLIYNIVKKKINIKEILYNFWKNILFFTLLILLIPFTWFLSYLFFPIFSKFLSYFF